VAATALFALLASKGAALLPAFAGDDISRFQEPSSLRFFIAQGRFVEGLVATTLQAAGVEATAAWWPMLVVLFPVAAAAIALSVCRAGGAAAPLPWLCLAAALAGAFPLWTELLYFRTAVPVHLVGMLAVLGFLLVPLSGLGRVSQVGLAAIAVVAALGAYQPLIGIFAAIVIAAWAEPGKPGARPWSRPLPLGFVAGVLGYAVLSLLLVKLFGGALSNIEARGGLIAQDEVLARAWVGLLSLLLPFGAAEPTMGRPLFVALVVFMVLVALPALVAAPRRTMVALAVLLVASAAALAPLLPLKTLWMTPRTMLAGGFALAIALALLGGAVPRLLRWPAVPVGAVLALLLPGVSTQSLLDQVRANRWDFARAQAIAHDVLRANGGVVPQRVVLVGRIWIHGVRLRSWGMDRNIPMLAIAWAVQGGFREATGMAWVVELEPAAPEVCAGRPLWPGPEAIVFGPAAVHVCLHAAG
jgi:hypothetical protein